MLSINYSDLISIFVELFMISIFIYFNLIAIFVILYWVVIGIMFYQVSMMVMLNCLPFSFLCWDSFLTYWIFELKVLFFNLCFQFGLWSLWYSFCLLESWGEFLSCMREVSLSFHFIYILNVSWRSTLGLSSIQLLEIILFLFIYLFLQVFSFMFIDKIIIWVPQIHQYQ